MSEKPPQNSEAEILQDSKQYEPHQYQNTEVVLKAEFQREFPSFVAGLSPKEYEERFAAWKMKRAQKELKKAA